MQIRISKADQSNSLTNFNFFICKLISIKHDHDCVRFHLLLKHKRHRNQLHNFILMLQADKEVEVQIRILTAPQLQHTLLSPQLKEQVVSTLAMQTVVGLIRLLKHDGIKQSYRKLRLFAYQTSELNALH